MTIYQEQRVHEEIQEKLGVKDALKSTVLVSEINLTVPYSYNGNGYYRPRGSKMLAVSN